MVFRASASAGMLWFKITYKKCSSQLNSEKISRLLLVYALFSYMHFPCASLQTTAIDIKRNMAHELKCDDFFIGNCKENVYFGFCRSSSRMSPCSLTDEGKGRGQKW